jgi:ribosomal protein S18 acetylase RimI-like enzyme
MGATPELIQAAGEHEFVVGRLLFEEYALSLSVDLCFQDFAGELEQLVSMYGPPRGCLLLARLDDIYLACGGLRRLSDSVCEMKRLYVRPAGRGAGLGRRLAIALIDAAGLLGYKRMVLDSLVDMMPAQNLYRSLGFRDAAAYYQNPTPGVVYMQRDL